MLLFQDVLASNIETYDWTWLQTIIACLALILSIVSLYLQFKSGELVLPTVKAVGIWLFFNYTKSDDNPFTGNLEKISCIVPLVVYNTGNKHKSIVDSRLIADFQDVRIELYSNHFMEDISDEGKHEYPKAIGWAHQLVKPKDTVLRYVEYVQDNFLEDEVNRIAESLRKENGITFYMEVLSENEKKYLPAKKFVVEALEITANSFGSRYTVYRTKSVKDA